MAMFKRTIFPYNLFYIHIILIDCSCLKIFYYCLWGSMKEERGLTRGLNKKKYAHKYGEKLTPLFGAHCGTHASKIWVIIGLEASRVGKRFPMKLSEC